MFYSYGSIIWATVRVVVMISEFAERTRAVGRGRARRKLRGHGLPTDITVPLGHLFHLTIVVEHLVAGRRATKMPVC